MTIPNMQPQEEIKQLIETMQDYGFINYDTDSWVYDMGPNRMVLVLIQDNGLTVNFTSNNDQYYINPVTLQKVLLDDLDQDR